MASPRLVTPAFYEQAPVHFQATHTIAATADEVFAALADTPSWPQWFPSINKAWWSSEAPHGVGSTRSVRVSRFTIDEQFIVWEPGARWGFSFVGTSFPVVRAAAELVELVAVEGGTHVTYHLFVEPLPGFGLLTRAIRGGVQKGLQEGLRGLAEHLATA